MAELFIPTVRQVYERVKEKYGTIIDIPKLATWYPDLFVPLMTQRDECEAGLQEEKAQRIAERRNFRQKLYKDIRRKFNCEIPDSLNKKLEYFEKLDELGSLYGILMNVASIDRFEKRVEKKIERKLRIDP